MSKSDNLISLKCQRSKKRHSFLISRGDVTEVMEERLSVDTGSVVLTELQFHLSESFLRIFSRQIGRQLPGQANRFTLNGKSQSEHFKQTTPEMPRSDLFTASLSLAGSSWLWAAGTLSQSRPSCGEQLSGSPWGPPRQEKARSLPLPSLPDVSLLTWGLAKASRKQGLIHSRRYYYLQERIINKQCG